MPVIWLALVSPPWMFSASAELYYLRCSSINKLRNVFSSSTSWKKENAAVHQNLPAPTSPSSSLLIHLPGPWRSAVINSTIGTCCDAASLTVSLHCHANTRVGPLPVCLLQSGPAACESSWSQLSNGGAPRGHDAAIDRGRPAAGRPRGAKLHVFDPVSLQIFFH